MLANLKIENIALIENLEIEFNNGLNVLTGETGAGKSIIIDSLNFVLGARSDKSLIRDGEQKAKVDAVFDITNNDGAKQFLIDNDLEVCDEVLISRSMSLDGKSDVRINGQIMTVVLLKELTSNLVDIYGQQEQVGLLKAKNQLVLLDKFCGVDLADLLSLYQSKLKELKQVNQNLDTLSGDFDSIEKEKDYLEFVIHEIESAKLTTTEEDDLINEKHKITNIEKIISNTISIENALREANSLLSQSVSSISNASQYDEDLVSLSNRLQSSKIELEDVYEEVLSYNQNNQYDERKFEEIDNRLDEYKRLKRKYGESVDEVNKYLEDAKDKLNKLNSSKEEVEKLLLQKQSLLKQLFALNDDIEKIRKQKASLLSQSLLENLKPLGMPSAQISFNFEDNERVEENLTSTGLNGVEIMFSANLGQEVKPLGKVASGGELSRLMLAIKAVVADYDNMPTMVFDEIDTGISGKMSQAVSEKIAIISKKHQVLVITHSAQIAAMADSNYLIEKQEVDGKTISKVSLLNLEQKIEEIARFISVDNTLELSLINAKALVEEQDKFKINLK